MTRGNSLSIPIHIYITLEVSENVDDVTLLHTYMTCHRKEPHRLCSYFKEMYCKPNTLDQIKMKKSSQIKNR